MENKIIVSENLKGLIIFFGIILERQKKGCWKSIQTPLKNLNYKISTILGKDQSDGGVLECYQI